MLHYFKAVWIYLDTAVPLIVMLLAAFILLKNKRAVLQDRIILFFLFLQVILNGSANYLSEHDINNQWLFHCNAFFTQCAFTAYFYSTLTKKKFKRLPIAGFLMFTIVFVLNIIYVQPLAVFNSYTFAIGSFLIVLYALLSFRQLIYELPVHKIQQLKDFWLLTALLTYFGSCFFIFISYNYISVVAPKSVGVLWFFNDIFLSISCVLLYKAISCKEWIQK